MEVTWNPLVTALSVTFGNDDDNDSGTSPTTAKEDRGRRQEFPDGRGDDLDRRKPAAQRAVEALDAAANADTAWLVGACMELLLHPHAPACLLDCIRRFFARRKGQRDPTLRAQRALPFLHQRLIESAQQVLDCVLRAGASPPHGYATNVPADLESRLHALIVAAEFYVPLRDEPAIALAYLVTLARWRRFDIRLAACEKLIALSPMAPAFIFPVIAKAVRFVGDNVRTAAADAGLSSTLTTEEREGMRRLQTAILRLIVGQQSRGDPWAVAALRPAIEVFDTDVVASSLRTFVVSPFVETRVRSEVACEMMVELLPRAIERSAADVQLAAPQYCFQPWPPEYDAVRRFCSNLRGAQLLNPPVTSRHAVWRAIDRARAATATVYRGTVESDAGRFVGNHPAPRLLCDMALFNPALLGRYFHLRFVEEHTEGPGVDTAAAAALALLLIAATRDTLNPVLEITGECVGVVERMLHQLCTSEHVFYQSLGLRAASVVSLVSDRAQALYFTELSRHLGLGAPSVCTFILEATGESLSTLQRITTTTLQGDPSSRIEAAIASLRIRIAEAAPWLVDVIVRLPAVSSAPPCVARNCVVEAVSNLLSVVVPRYVPTLTQFEVLLYNARAAAARTAAIDRAEAGSSKLCRLAAGVAVHLNGSPVDLSQMPSRAAEQVKAETVRSAEAETIVTFCALLLSRPFLRGFDKGRPAPKGAGVPLRERFEEISAARALVLDAMEAMICDRRSDDRERGFPRKLHMCAVVVEGFSHGLLTPERARLGRRLVPLALLAIDDRDEAVQAHNVRANGMRLLATVAVARGSSAVSAALQRAMCDCVTTLLQSLKFGGLPTDDPMVVARALYSVLEHATDAITQRWGAPVRNAKTAAARRRAVAQLGTVEDLRRAFVAVRCCIATVLPVLVAVRRHDTAGLRLANAWLVRRLLALTERVDITEAEHAKAIAAAAAPAPRRKKTTRQGNAAVDEATVPAAALPPLTDSDKAMLSPPELRVQPARAAAMLAIRAMPFSVTAIGHLVDFIVRVPSLAPPEVSRPRVPWALTGFADSLTARNPGNEPQTLYAWLLVRHRCIVETPRLGDRSIAERWGTDAFQTLLGRPSAPPGSADDKSRPNLALVHASCALLLSLQNVGLLRVAGSPVRDPMNRVRDLCCDVLQFNSQHFRDDDPTNVSRQPDPLPPPVDAFGNRYLVDRVPMLPTVAFTVPELDEYNTGFACWHRMQRMLHDVLALVVCAITEPGIIAGAERALDETILPTLIQYPRALGYVLTGRGTTRESIGPFLGAAGNDTRRRFLEIVRDPTRLPANVRRSFVNDMTAVMDQAKESSPPARRNRAEK